VLDDQPQAAASQLVRLEDAAMSATAARLPVTGAIHTLATYGVVMGFNFGYSRVPGQFDTGWQEIVLDGGVGLSSKGAPLLHFHARSVCRKTRKRAGF